jgi:hypothetical protein
MDDFRVGSIPPSDPYGHREPAGSFPRRRPKQRYGESDDEFEAEAAAPDPDNDTGTEAPIEDYYVPSEPKTDE